MAKAKSKRKVAKLTRNNSSRKVKATYDAASTGIGNESYWQYVDGMSAIDANNESVRKTIRERARYEFDNNTYCQGIAKTIAKDTIGRGGPRLNLTGDTTNHLKLQADYTAWQKEVKYAQKLRNMRMSKMKDGEVWILPVTKKKLKSSVKLYFQTFETEQVGSSRNSKTQVDGIYLDEFGEAKAYNLYESSPTSGVTLNSSKIKSEDMIQYAYMTRPGQVRGISEFTPALGLFVQLRSYTLSVLTASETAANLAAVLETKANADDECDEVEAEYEFEISRNAIKTMPHGWGISQLKAEQPNNSYVEFKKEVLNEIARTLEVPRNVAMLDSSGYNYASGRLDFQEYWKSLDVEQGDINEIINDPLFEMYVKEWKVINRIAKLDTAHTWVYDSRPHVDPGKEANAEKTRLENCTTNLAIACAKDGNDWKDVIDQKLKEEKYIQDQRKNLGIEVNEGENNNEQN